MTADFDTIRAALKENGVYGSYERSNTPPALAALDRVQAVVEQAEKALGNLRGLAQKEIDNNPALGIPGYRKGMLARETLAVLRDQKDTA